MFTGTVVDQLSMMHPTWGMPGKSTIFLFTSHGSSSELFLGKFRGSMRHRGIMLKVTGISFGRKCENFTYLWNVLMLPELGL